MTDRARVPFALIGVLLLVGSGAIAVTEHDPPARQPAVDEALDGLAAESQTALRVAVRRAAREAARRPVLAPANTTVGSQLDERRPFVDALRLRVYVRARERLRRLDDRRRGLAVSARLPPIEGPEDVGSALQRVTVSRAGPDGTRLRVHLDGLQLLARRDGRIVGRATRNATVVVHTPVLLVHHRVERFEERLNAPIGQPGLATRLTAVLYPVAWARGYAQFAGHPIENVVANRHVAVVTNGAVLGLQRRAFGRMDPLGRRVYERSLAEVAVEDLAGASNASALARLQRLRGKSGRAESAGETLDRLEPSTDATGRREPMIVGINRTADVAYVSAVADLNRTLDRTYAPAVRVRADVSRLDRSTSRDGRPRRAESRLEVTRITRTSVRNRSGTPPAPATGWHRLFGASRTVTVTERRITTWALDGNETATAIRTERTTHAVDVLVAGDHVVGPAPPGRISVVHDPGGPFDSPNLADARALARDHVADRGGIDALARRAAVGELDEQPHRLQADRPAALAAWTRPDLTRLRERVRNISVTVERGRIATFEANVPGLLAAELRDRRGRLVDAPDAYGSVAERARVGVRADYVDRVLERLDDAAAGHQRGRKRLGGALPGTDRSPAEMLAAGRRAGPVGPTHPGPPIRMRVDAAPSYLTLEAVDHGTVPAIVPNRTEHPLVARNVNAFAVPTDGVVEALFGLLDGPEKTSFRSAARVLRVASRTNTTGPRTALLRLELRKSLFAYRTWTAETLARHDLGTDASRREVVAAGLSRWESVGARVAAVSNGSAAAAIHEEAVDRWSSALADRADREVLAIDLATSANEAKSATFFQPTRANVNGTANRVRTALGVARGRAKSIASEKAAALAAKLPSGVPVLPAPGLWYAMVNAWHVEVRGSYARFVVRVPRGAPDRLPADLRYVRENATVRLDVDGDGTAERLGRNRRIAFSAETVVGVAVPPRPRGVGDEGERDERSPGWPTPGPK